MHYSRKLQEKHNLSIPQVRWKRKSVPEKRARTGGVKFVSFSVALLGLFRQNLQQSIFCGLFLRKGGVEIGDDFREDGRGGANGCDLGSGLTYFQFSI